MVIDWSLLAIIVAPVLALFVGAALNRIIEKRSKLISYLGHVSAFTLQDKKTQVYTHAVVIRNAGKKAAKNIRIGHYTLPDYQLYPVVTYDIVDLDNGGKELVIPTLVPGEQITISYLYSPPLTWDKVNSYAKCDDGFAKILSVIPTPQPAKWLVRLFWFFVFAGFTAVIYVLIKGIGWVILLAGKSPAG